MLAFFSKSLQMDRAAVVFVIYGTLVHFLLYVSAPFFAAKLNDENKPPGEQRGLFFGNNTGIGLGMLLGLAIAMLVTLRFVHGIGAARQIMVLVLVMFLLYMVNTGSYFALVRHYNNFERARQHHMQKPLTLPNNHIISVVCIYNTVLGALIAAAIWAALPRSRPEETTSKWYNMFAADPAKGPELVQRIKKRMTQGPQEDAYAMQDAKAAMLESLAGLQDARLTAYMQHELDRAYAPDSTATLKEVHETLRNMVLPYYEGVHRGDVPAVRKALNLCMGRLTEALLDQKAVKVEEDPEPEPTRNKVMDKNWAEAIKEAPLALALGVAATENAVVKGYDAAKSGVQATANVAKEAARLGIKGAVYLPLAAGAKTAKGVDYALQMAPSGGTAKTAAADVAMFPIRKTVDTAKFVKDAMKDGWNAFDKGVGADVKDMMMKSMPQLESMSEDEINAAVDQLTGMVENILGPDGNPEFKKYASLAKSNAVNMMAKMALGLGGGSFIDKALKEYGIIGFLQANPIIKKVINTNAKVIELIKTYPILKTIINRVDAVLVKEEKKAR